MRDPRVLVARVRRVMTEGYSQGIGIDIGARWTWLLFDPCFMFGPTEALFR